MPPTGDQGPVVREARQRARALLARGEPFVWNATNLSRRIRSECIDLFAAYDARVRIVYVETTANGVLRRNRARPRPVTADSIERLLDRWEVPGLTEAHRVEWLVEAPDGG